MPDPVFERYKEALKQGHVAVFKGQHKEALARYQEAATLAGPPAPALREHGLRAAPDGSGTGCHRGLRRGAARALRTIHRRSRARHRRCWPQASAQSPRSSSSRSRGWRPTRPVSVSSRRRTRRPQRGRVVPSGCSRSRRPPVGTVTSVPPSRDSCAAAAGYQQQGHLDAALDACQRALGVSLGAPAAHLQMARIYFQRGWVGPRGRAAAAPVDGC